MGDIKLLVDRKISDKKVMVFSKIGCPYCNDAKDVLRKYKLSANEIEIWEIGGLRECGAIQNYLHSITGGRSVPRVFINGQFIGGGDETVAAHRSGKLKALLNK